MQQPGHQGKHNGGQKGGHGGQKGAHGGARGGQRGPQAGNKNLVAQKRSHLHDGTAGKIEQIKKQKMLQRRQQKESEDYGMYFVLRWWVF
jgi:hypothetical protein